MLKQSLSTSCSKPTSAVSQVSCFLALLPCLLSAGSASARRRTCPTFFPLDCAPPDALLSLSCDCRLSPTSSSAPAQSVDDRFLALPWHSPDAGKSSSWAVPTLSLGFSRVFFCEEGDLLFAGALPLFSFPAADETRWPCPSTRTSLSGSLAVCISPSGNTIV